MELGLTIATLGAVFVRCGLNNAVQRYYWDAGVSEAERSVLVSTGFWLTFGVGVVCGVCAFFIVPLIFKASTGGVEQLGSMGVLAIAALLPLLQWSQYLQDVLRLHFAPWKFLGYTFTSRALGSLIALFLVLHFGAGVEGVLLAQASTLLLALPLGIWLVKKDFVVNLDRPWAGRLLAFGTPFIFTEVAYWLFASIDRWMLAAMAGVSEVGIYSVAFRFSTLAVFVATAFGMAWSPYAVKVRADHPQSHRQVYAEVLLILLVVMLCVAGSIALFAGEFIGAIMSPDYAAATIPLTVLCFTAVFQATQQVTAIGISLANRTKIFAGLAWAAAILNVALNFWLIPWFGATGAATATLISCMLLSGGFLLFTQRLYPLPISWIRLLWLCLLGAVVFFSSIHWLSQEFDLAASAVKLCIALVCVVLAMLSLNFRVFRSL
ncbi:Membrane protein involved in the export of O-antigen and teichoic acid [Geopseudomonas guangdongensis]|uniref:Membrane protein involved in the export of O-antigen and teichoic acid n=2 Tax=Geopseudomonas guangdongensis TaxID=1245526 RepID=A0A1H2E779_9GAMM|nr:Membrane protein involved in the export of O-antigen and teichoic acid [Pseudomonas guangdongensis]